MLDSKSLNYATFKKAYDLYYSACGNSYGFLYLVYLYKENLARIADNVDDNSDMTLVTVDRSVLDNHSKIVKGLSLFNNEKVLSPSKDIHSSGYLSTACIAVALAKFTIAKANAKSTTIDINAAFAAYFAGFCIAYRNSPVAYSDLAIDFIIDSIIYSASNLADDSNTDSSEALSNVVDRDVVAAAIASIKYRDCYNPRYLENPVHNIAMGAILSDLVDKRVVDDAVDTIRRTADSLISKGAAFNVAMGVALDAALDVLITSALKSAPSYLINNRTIENKGVLINISENDILFKIGNEILFPSINQVEYNSKAVSLLVFESFRELTTIDRTWLQAYYNELFDATIKREQEGKTYGTFVQPIEVTKLVCKLVNYTGGIVYNPFAGIASYGIELNAKDKYYGQEINPAFWAIGALRLLESNNELINYTCADSVDEWLSTHLVDLIISTPPFDTTTKESEMSSLHSSNVYTSFRDMFLRRAFSGLTENGILIGAFPAKSLALHEYSNVIDNDYLDTVVMLPENLFPQTAVSTVILKFSKKKQNKGKVKMVDGSSFFRKDRRNNRLEWENLLEAISRNDCQFVKTVTNKDIAEKHYDISPSLYLFDISTIVEIPVGFELKKMRELIFDSFNNNYKPVSSEVRRVMCYNLRGNRFVVNKTFEELTPNLLNHSRVLVLDKDALLLATKGPLSPTYFHHSEDFKVGFTIQNTICAYQFNTDLVYPEYLVSELCKEYISEQRKQGVEILDLSVLLPTIDLQKLLFNNELNLYKTLEAKAITLETALKKERERMFELLSMRKHRINPYFSGLQDNLDLIEDEFNENELIAFNHMINDDYSVKDAFYNIKESLSEMKTLFKDLTSELVVGTKEEFDIIQFFIQFNYVRKNPNIHFHVDTFPKSDMSNCIVLFNEDNLREVLENIVENAEKHALDYNNNKVRICYYKESDKCVIDILNNGEPLPNNFDEKLSFALGYTIGGKQGTGKGLARVKQICDELGAEISWCNNADDEYPVGMRLKLQIV